MSAPTLLYLDTPAFLKLLVAEEHSDALRSMLGSARRWSSTLLDVEAHRAALRLGVPRASVEAALETVALVMPSEATFASARDIGPKRLRTLDASHLATAAEMGDDLGAVVTYDNRLAACEDIGLAVRRPE